MRIVALGTGDAFGGAGRGHTCFALADAGGLALVDAGATVMQGLFGAGLDPLAIGAVHFTHLHGDHIAGWPFLLVHAVRRGKRTAPLVVTGPPGTAARLSTLWAACYADTSQTPLAWLEVIELAAGEVREVAGRRVEAFRAQHMRPPHEALSLRISSGEATVAFTGDTGPHEGLVDLARGARVLLGECTDLAARAGETKATGADIVPVGRRHMAWDDWRLLLPRIDVPVRLVHLSTEARAAAPQIEAEGRALGDVRVLDDGDVIEI